MNFELKQNDIIADLHTHTIFSKHGFSTINENLNAAADHDMKYMAVTDHIYHSDDYIERKNEITRMVYVAKNVYHPDVSVISGGEFNLNQSVDTINADKLQHEVKWRLFGFHTWFLKPSSVDIKNIPTYFAQYIRASKTVKPTAFAHIERELSDCRHADDNAIKDCLIDIVNIAVENNIMLEINESSITANQSNIDKMKFWINYANERNAIFSLGTDAHFCKSVGVFTNAINLINEIGISPDKIINTKYCESELKQLLS